MFLTMDDEFDFLICQDKFKETYLENKAKFPELPTIEDSEWVKTVRGLPYTTPEFILKAHKIATTFLVQNIPVPNLYLQFLKTTKLYFGI